MNALPPKASLLIGANGLIGNAIAATMVDIGADVVLAARNLDGLRDLQHRLRPEASGEVRIVQLDVTDDDAMADLMQEFIGNGLDIAVNNVGSSHLPSPLAQLNIDEIDRVLAVSLRGVAVAMHHQLGVINDGGALVNIASTAGLAGVPGMSAYAAAKHGVIGLTKVAAMDYAARSIRVNAVAPGPIESGKMMTYDAEVREQVGSHVRMQRMGSAAEVAAAVRWLISTDSSFTTGTVIAVDGGKSS